MVSCNTAALKERSNLFWPLSVPYLNLLVNVHCQSGELLNKVSSCSVESTHRNLLKFFYMEKKKKRLYCKYILFCTFVWNFFTLYTNLFDEIATLYSRLYCDLDRSMYDCLFESWSAVWKGWEAFDWDRVCFVLMTKPWNMKCIKSLIFCTFNLINPRSKTISLCDFIVLFCDHIAADCYRKKHFCLVAGLSTPIIFFLSIYLFCSTLSDLYAIIHII